MALVAPILPLPAPEEAARSERLPLAEGPQGVLRRLRAELVRRKADWKRADERQRCPTGLPEVDALLGGGFRRGLVTSLAAEPGAGATTLIGRAIALATRQGHCCAWVDPEGALCAQALQSLGVELPRLLWVRPPADQLAWSVQLLVRSGAFALVVVELGETRLPTPVAHRLVEAARASECALVLLSRQGEPQAAVRARLEALTLRQPPVRLMLPPAALAQEEPRRRVRLWVERARSGGEASTFVQLHPAGLAAPDDRWLQPDVDAAGLSRTPGQDLDFGELPVRALVDRIHARPRSRWRPTTHDPAGASAMELRAQARTEARAALALGAS